MYEIHLHSLLENLATQGMIVGLFLAGAGLAFLLLGIRIFRALVVVSFGVIGFWIGYHLPIPELAKFGCGMLAAIGLAIASTWAVKSAVALLAGGWAGVIVLELLSALGANEQVSLVMAGFTAASVISLSFIAFHEIVAFVTSLEGSFLCLGAVVVFCSQNPAVWSYMRSMLTSSPVFAGFLILAGTVTGFYMQLADLRNKDMGVSI